ncbi:phytanoyl-CoA dioxygenase family protein [Scytonema hofmannii FACHB-248]|uniref:Phytanoyl-CoA dioxygenase family protein n=1 Tax=Scytonema hofmannii FACHB-248 TaxID=1842502 RepID=A0ABR8GUH9_9CYAN|nr:MULTISPECIES: phytanoyl-CoA dioxygenase family protein [Nostocales]MBD2607023.1 phytanoyl-CoA dioxygenase family protein [Scytonema hofmannii FACHB-248]
MTTSFQVKSFNPVFSVKLAFLYLLSRLKVIHHFLPKEVREMLPTGWNNRMFWVAFKSGGRKYFYDYYSKFKHPESYKPKVAVQSQFQMAEEEIKFFYDNGYVGPFDLMSAEEIKDLKNYLVNSVINSDSKSFSFNAGDYEFETENNPATDILSVASDKPTDEAKKFFINDMNLFNRHLDQPRLIDLFKNPAITERCAQLLGPDLILWRTRVFEIPPHSEGTKIHQANTWLFENQKQSVVNPPNSDKLFQVTCWIALTDATVDNGCMVVIPGSHEEMYPTILGEKSGGSHNTVSGNYETNFDYPLDTAEIRPIEVKAGQFFIFCERVLHGSLDNKTDASRFAINGRITRTDTRLYNDEMLKESHRVKIYNIKKISLENWKAVLIRGKDSFGYNRLM